MRNRRFDEALPKLLIGIQDDPNHPTAYRFLAACYAQMGRLSEARDTIKRLCAVAPAVVPNTSYLRNPEHRELLLSGLRLAMGEGR